jgi:hypothetical protein
MSTQDMKAGMEGCIECHRICFELAMNHCLETGGEHIEPAHFRLMINCAELCRTSSNFVLAGPDLDKLTYGLCAEVCRRYADDCQQLDAMEECAAACRRCAEMFERMVA